VSKVSRLSDESIVDPLLRPLLYRKLLAYVGDSTNTLVEYEIKEDEETNPELLAYRLYGDGNLRWIVGVMTNLPDEFMPLPVGYTVNFPPLSVIARTIREVRESA